MTAPTGLRTWTIVLPAPHRLWSANDSNRENRYAVADMRKAWRTAAYNAVTAAKLPTGLPRVAFDLTWHFTDNGRRDSLNYADTAKPIIDAYAPPFVQKPTKKKPTGAYAPGASVIADDTDAYIESTRLSIGELWQDVITAPDWHLTLADLRALDNAWGGVTIVCAERPPLPAAAKRKRTPTKDVIPADVRRRLALSALTGTETT